MRRQTMRRQTNAVAARYVEVKQRRWAHKPVEPQLSDDVGVMRNRGHLGATFDAGDDFAR